MGATLDRWRNVRFTRWTASIASVALLLAVSAWLAHQHDTERTVSSVEQSCELCLQLTTVGAAPAVVSALNSPLPVQCLLPADTSPEPTLRLAHSYLSRAPPRS